MAVVFFGQLAHGGTVPGNVPLFESYASLRQKQFDDVARRAIGLSKKDYPGFHVRE
jgi:hypothetical protein